MLLKDLLDNLIRIELNNIADGKPEWSEGNFSYTKLIQCMSSGYIELHKRFTLKKEIVRIQPLEGVNDYVLDIKHALSNTASAEIKFILDSETNPFSNNIAKIDGIHNYCGKPVDFNTTRFDDSIDLKDYRTLFIKEPDVNHPLTLVCRAIPAPIVLQDENELETYEIDLPYTYHEALILYAAGRAYSGRGAENATNNESAVFMARFEASCAQINYFGLDTHESMVNDKLTARGFV
jgi:hypothetical protein